MATSSGVRIVKNDLARVFKLYRENVPAALADGLQEAGQSGVRAMRERVATAATYTGGERGDPGRVLSGDLYESAQARITTDSNGNASLTLGFLDGPEYAIFQEEGTRGKGGAIAGGGSGGIEPMLAVQAGFTVLASELFDRLAAALAEAGEDAAALRAYKRARRTY